ncbi:hypothetical protein [Parapedobacter tibetensis]|uniref:hypothetical protein n=1 Tax=Parapedobacter tibetensis TaxID=2972951 RepID=UPI00214D13CB|nr:hypothetical protein [Parapedobacter tibetensis]
MADLLYVSRPTYRSWEMDIEKMPLGSFKKVVSYFKLSNEEIKEVLNIDYDILNTTSARTSGSGIEGIQNDIKSIKSFLFNGVKNEDLR